MQAILFGIAAIGILVSYNPPPTRFQREQDPKELFKSLDFIGIGILKTGFVITLLPLVWAGSIYPWKSSQVISMLVVGHVLLIVFGLYGSFSLNMKQERIPTQRLTS
jgi:hypothetical protein